MGNDYRTNIKSYAAERIDKAKRIKIVCNSEIAAYFVLFNVVCGDNDYYLGAVLKLEEHLYLCIGKEARKHARRMEIVEKLTAEFKIQLATEIFDAVADILRLHRNVFVIIKAYCLHKHPVRKNITATIISYIPTCFHIFFVFYKKFFPPLIRREKLVLHLKNKYAHYAITINICANHSSTHIVRHRPQMVSLKRTAQINLSKSLLLFCNICLCSYQKICISLSIVGVSFAFL